MGAHADALYAPPLNSGPLSHTDNDPPPSVLALACGGMVRTRLRPPWRTLGICRSTLQTVEPHEVAARFPLARDGPKAVPNHQNRGLVALRQAPVGSTGQLRDRSHSGNREPAASLGAGSAGAVGDCAHTCLRDPHLFAHPRIALGGTVPRVLGGLSPGFCLQGARGAQGLVHSRTVHHWD